MKVIAAIYRGFCKVEETIVAVFVAAITILVFSSAIARFAGRPINWAPDTSLLLLSWVIFLGADCALRRADLIRVDVILLKFPEKLQNFLYYFYYVMIIGFLLILIRFGVSLAAANTKRNFQGMEISYSWATISVPIGAFLMIITIILKLVKRWKENPIIKIAGKEEMV
jgi:TRAP-type C4-dicarboxylate transport system permease small subunit